jgi:hypothetical protein
MVPQVNPAEDGHGQRPTTGMVLVIVAVVGGGLVLLVLLCVTWMRPKAVAGSELKDASAVNV